MSRYRGRLELLLTELRGLPAGERPEAELAREVLAALRERYEEAVTAVEEAPPLRRSKGRGK